MLFLIESPPVFFTSISKNKKQKPNPTWTFLTAMSFAITSSALTCLRVHACNNLFGVPRLNSVAMSHDLPSYTNEAQNQYSVHNSREWHKGTR